MSSQARMRLKAFGSLLLVALAVGFVRTRYHRFWRAGESGAEVWFYDPQKRQLYPVPRDTVPPDSGGHGGVRAVVVAFPGEGHEPEKRRIAYLETYGPPLKEALERLKLARNSGTVSKEPPPARDSALFRTNDLVRRVDEPEWHPANSAEGRKVRSEWESWRSASGQRAVVCLP